MTEWKEYKLGDVATFAYGKLPKKELLGKGNYITFSGYKYVDSYPEYNCEKGDVILVARGVGGTGDVKLTMQRCFLTNLSIKIVLDNSIVLNDYFYNMFRQENLRYLDSGSAQSQITIQDLGNVIIEVPSVNVQRKVSAILSSIDDKIDLLYRENATLEQMAETLFRQWFLVEAKEEWEDVLLGNLIDIGSGKGLQRSDFVENGFYSVLGANGEIGKTNKYLVSESDRVIYTGRVGTLGNVFRLENEKAWLSDNTLVIKPKEYYNFVYFVLKLSRLQDYNVGSTQPLIRQSDIKEIELVLPDRGILNAFEKECDLIYEKVENNNKQIQTLIQTRDGLLPRLMGGEVKI